MTNTVVNQPKFSVVIPAYNQAEYLNQAVQSVLDQTFKDFEVIVVNDASPDNTQEVVNRFGDRRIRYLSHPENRGLPATRNTGMRASTGDFIALLDADDFFHSQKLETHLDFLEKHPDIDVSYNNRFELNYSSDTIRELYGSPEVVSLKDLVIGFPFCPSDMVIRKRAAVEVDLFDEQYIHGGEDTDFPCRLALAGCRFAHVDRVLNYRRHHSGRRRKNLLARRDDWLKAINNVFADPRCPNGLAEIRNIAFTEHYLVLIYLAFAQEETSLGQLFLREALNLSPDIVHGNPSRLVDHLVRGSIADESLDHAALLGNIFFQLPPEIIHLREQYKWGVGRGYLLKGVRAVMWGRIEDGQVHFQNAIKWGAEVDEFFLRKLTSQVIAYEVEFGYESTQNMLKELTTCLTKVSGRKFVRHLAGSLSFNRALRNYHHNEYSKVPLQIINALVDDPKKYISNRGMWSVLLRSIEKKVF